MSQSAATSFLQKHAAPFDKAERPDELLGRAASSFEKGPLLLFLVCAALFVLHRKPSQKRTDCLRVSHLDHFFFVLSDLSPWGRGQAPLLRRLHTKYGHAIQIGETLFSFAPSGDTASDAELFRAMSRLPKSERVYGAFDVPIADEKGALTSHQTIFTQRDAAIWRQEHKKVAPMFRAQNVREKQIGIWQLLKVLHVKMDALAERDEIDLSPVLRAFAADTTCAWLVQVSYGALESLKDGQTYESGERDIGPILNALNREFGWSYYSPALSGWWQTVKTVLDVRFQRWGVMTGLTARWAAAEASLKGWTDFVDEAVLAGFDPPGSFSDHFVSLLLEGASSEPAKDAASAQLSDAIFAGTDTITAALTFSLYILASQTTAIKVAISRIRKELPAEPWQLQDLENLPWLSATIKELLRLSDPNPHLLERVVAEPSEGLPLALSRLPVGSRVGVSGYVMHRSPVVYGDRPNDFFPRRWLPIDHPDHALPPGTAIKAEELHVFSMPFGRAPRACIAQVFANAILTATLATMIARYDLEQRGAPDLVEKGWRDCFNKVLYGEGRVAVAVRRRK